MNNKTFSLFHFFLQISAKKLQGHINGIIKVRNTLISSTPHKTIQYIVFVYKVTPMSSKKHINPKHTTKITRDVFLFLLFFILTKRSYYFHFYFFFTRFQFFYFCDYNLYSEISFYFGNLAFCSFVQRLLFFINLQMMYFS